MTRSKGFNSFKLIALLGAALYAFLFVSLVVCPNSFTEGACEAGGEMVYFMARRVSVMMFSFGLLLFLSRNAERSWLRTGLCVTIAFSMAGFASTGIHEYATGGIGASIFASVGIEVTYAAMFACQAVADYRKLRVEGGK